MPGTVYLTSSAAETQELGRTLASCLGPGDVVAFFGDLGSGKTTMIKGICAGLGVAEVVKSPSFVIVSEYQGRIPAYHVDLYRLAPGDSLEAIGLESYFGGDGVCLVEWAERAESVLPSETIRITLAVEGAGRRIEVWGLSGRVA
jgi:tRNA threonylcarbamoyladenosine biosynthesis protein TsaE